MLYLLKIVFRNGDALMNSQQPAVSKAMRFIKDDIQSGEWKHGHRLPSVRRLALLAGVSMVSMWKALHGLAGEGIICFDPGTGRAIAGPTPHPKTSFQPLQAQKWEQICSELENQIIFGELSTTRFIPSAGELAARYGVHRHTMKKALHKLHRTGLVRPYRKQFEVLGTRHGTSATSITLVVNADAKSIPRIYGTLREFVQALESLSTRNNLRLSVLGYNILNPTKFLKTVHKQKNNLGHIVWIGESYDSQDREAFTEFAVSAAKNVPVAVIDERGDFFASNPGICSSMLRIFTLAAHKAGEDLGRALLSLGHTKVGFCSICSSAWWSAARFKGLCAAYGKAGFPDGVVAFTSNNKFGPYSAILAFAGISLQQRRAMLNINPTTNEFTKKESLQRYSELLGREEAPLVAPDASASIKSLLSIMLRELKEHPSADYLPRLDYFIYEYMVNEGTGYLCRPLLDSLLDCHEITAVVGANDAIALQVLRYFQKKGTTVPGKISVCSFDNSGEAFDKGLTSYSFDMPKVAKMASSFLIEPERFSRAIRENPLEVQGSVILRKSTSKRK
jgi:DNA-binding transcriptional regulator YhcF (GntR family)